MDDTLAWMEKGKGYVHQVVDYLHGMQIWQWVVFGIIVLFVMKKPIKRFYRRKVKKVVKVVFRLARLYFFMH